MRCKDCGFWEEDTPGYGICHFLIGALALGERIRFCQIFRKRSKLPIKNVDIVTCADFGCIHAEEKADIKVLDINDERFKISGHDLHIVADVKNKHSYTLQVSDLAIIGNDWRDMEQFS